ncbi:hypothetical protein [Desulfopila sp. IMCC35008]|uniref:hypothetical protein n=1 Tax=Desulfopila sp. IMCC35008 TaxID=2653858 RepID=UPI0013D78A03|nr:hypothetical protein [Desulfopila sp. IMCC35008]
MSEKTTDKKQQELTQEELAKLDDDLHSIDMLYRSRCVQPPKGVNNVVVREIVKDEK